jgi:N-acetylmuramoyl-L-alanine amidase
MKNADADIITMTPSMINFPPVSLADAILTIDAGHGGSASGATSSDGQVLEKDVNLKIALELQRLLQEQGVGTIWMTRSKDDDVSLAYRVDLATASGGHLFISIHNNDGPTGTHGTETYYQCGNEQTLDTKQKSQDLAQEVQNNLLLAVNSCTPSFDRGIKCRLWGKRDYYYVLRNTMIPAVLAECVFMSDPDEVNCLNQDTFLTSLAEGLHTGIIAFLN